MKTLAVASCCDDSGGAHTLMISEVEDEILVEGTSQVGASDRFFAEMVTSPRCWWWRDVYAVALEIAGKMGQQALATRCMSDAAASLGGNAGRPYAGPTLEGVAHVLNAIRLDALQCGATQGGVEVRLQVYDDGTWAVRWGDPRYDPDTKGRWWKGWLSFTGDNVYHAAGSLMSGEGRGVQVTRTCEPPMSGRSPEPVAP